MTEEGGEDGGGGEVLKRPFQASKERAPAGDASQGRKKYAPHFHISRKSRGLNLVAFLGFEAPLPPKRIRLQIKLNLHCKHTL